MILPKGSIMKWNGTSVTEHNRAGLNVEVERIEKKNRMANGMMRKWVIADKRTWSTSWENLPHSATYTVDNAWGGTEMETFFNANAGGFTLSIVTATGSQDYSVMFDNFSKVVVKRGRYDFWTVNVSLVEV